MGAWVGRKVAEFLSNEAPIKIGPNGVDVGISEVWRIPEDGIITIHGSVRKIEPDKSLVIPDGEGFYNLDRGAYELRIANKISIPSNAVCFFYPRSTFNRLGVTKCETAVGDSGYSGYATQSIYISVKRLKVHKDEKWFQIVYFDMKETPDVLYDGHWQGEKKVENNA